MSRHGSVSLVRVCFFIAMALIVATCVASDSAVEAVLHHNPDSEQPRQLRGLSSSSSSVIEKPAIVTFILQKTNLSQLCDTFKTLHLLKGDADAPVLVFDSQEITTAQQEALGHCVSGNRRLKFNKLNLQTSFPYDLLPHPPSNLNPLHFDADDWSPQLMDRFLTYSLWLHPALRQYTTVMRINDDTCFTLGMKYLPLFSSSSHLYTSQLLSHPDVSGVTNINALYSFATDYVQKNQINVAHPELWSTIRHARENGKAIPVFQKEFELVSKEFMQRDDVQKWHAAVTEYEPHGVFRYNWTTGYIRIFTVAIFLKPSEVNIENPPAGYVQKDFRNTASKKPVHYQFCSTTSINGDPNGGSTLILDEENE